MNTQQSISGLVYTICAFLIWGLSPVYFKHLRAVPPFEILLHRMVWSFFLLLPLLPVFKRWRAFLSALKNVRTLFILLVTTILVGFNWFLFIWAINNDHILQTSLGYFINPLVNVLLGTVFLRERIRKFQFIAVVLAGSGVLYLTIQHGEFPWVSLALAFTFAFYALIRKVAPVDALEGLSVETLLLSIPAACYLYYIGQQGSGAMLTVSRHTDLLLMGTSLITAVPLLLFNMGAKRLNLITLGFLQYIAPSCTFMLAVFIYGEPFSAAQGWTFGLIWTALAIFSFDAVRDYRRAL